MSSASDMICEPFLAIMVSVPPLAFVIETSNPADGVTGSVMV